MDTAFHEYQNNWKLLAQHLEQTKPEIGQVIGEGKIWLSHIIELTNKATIKDTNQNLLHEFSRLYSRVMRRFFAVNQSANYIYIDLVKDELRTITEILFKTFYLLRSDNPEQFALDALNLSALSWMRNGERLYASGKLPELNLTEEQKGRRAKVENEIFAKYKGRKPKFYADKTLIEVARTGGLEWVYELGYGWLSAHSHNQPFSEMRSLLNDDNGARIALFPDSMEIDRYAGIIGVLNQTATVASLAALSGFAEVDKIYAHEVLFGFKESYKNHGWNKEIETIAQSWDIVL